MTGDGLTLGDVHDDEAASATVIYRRHHPIQPPQLRAAGPFAPGAAINRLVIRSDKDMTQSSSTTPTPTTRSQRPARWIRRPHRWIWSNNTACLTAKPTNNRSNWRSARCVPTYRIRATGSGG